MHQHITSQIPETPRVHHRSVSRRVPAIRRCATGRHATVFAALTWSGTWIGKSIPSAAGARWPAALVLCVVLMWPVARDGHMGTTTQRGVMLPVVLALMLASVAAGAWSWQSRATVEAGSCEGWATIRADPMWRRGRLVTILEMDSRRMRVDARGSVANRLAPRASGEQMYVRGECMPLTEPVSSRDAVAHVVGRLQISAVDELYGAGSPAVRASNRVRRLVASGVSSMSPEMQALFLGLVMGDDRAQSPETVASFRNAGMSHLTAVSGQNVAYLLAMMTPLLGYLSRTRRLAATLAVIAWFVMLTRGEPSVLRAAVMASLVAVGGFFRWGLHGRIVVAATTIVLLLVDPMLCRSVGFALSVGATAGLAWCSAAIGRIVGTRGWRAMVSSTLAAQAGTIAISTAIFGVPPVVSLLANPLSIPVAGVVMTVGLPLALVAAVAAPVAPIVVALLTPMVAWVAGVARIASMVTVPTWVNVAGWGALAIWIVQRQRHVLRARHTGMTQ